MRLYVDYTNWKGKREWREIELLPNGGSYVAFSNYSEASDDGKINVVYRTYVLHVAMVDRGGARRTLKLANIHGFKVEEA